MIRRFFSRLRNRDGQALIMAAIVFPLVLLFLAFVVDTAHAFVDQKHLQNTADAASLAAAQQLNGGVSGCTSLANCASQYVSVNNGPSGMVECADAGGAPIHAFISSDPSATPNCYQWPYYDKNGNPHNDQVVVWLYECNATFFGGILGISQVCASVHSVSQATVNPLLGTINQPGFTTGPQTIFSTSTTMVVSNGSTSYIPSTTTTIIPGVTTGSSTVYSTSTSTTPFGGHPVAIFAYTHDGTDPCSSTSGIVINGNPATNIDALVSNGSVNTDSHDKSTIAYAGYGTGPGCGLNKAGTGTVSGSGPDNPYPFEWPVSFTPAERTAICTSAGATNKTVAIVLPAGSTGIYCSTVSIELDGASGGYTGGANPCPGEGITLIAPIVTDPGNAANANLCPSNLPLTKGLTFWMYGAGQSFTWSHNNSSLNGVIWIQNGDMSYTGNSGTTGLYEAQNISVTGNSFIMKGLGPPVGGGTVTNTVTSTVGTTPLTSPESTSLSTSTSTIVNNGSTSLSTNTIPINTLPGTTQADSTQTVTTGVSTNLKLKQ